MVSSVETAEQSHYSRQSLINFFIRSTLDPTNQLLVRIPGDEVWSLVALVHEGLEGGITCHLEFEIVAETCLN